MKPSRSHVWAWLAILLALAFVIGTIGAALAGPKPTPRPMVTTSAGTIAAPSEKLLDAYAKFGIYHATPRSFTCGFCGKRFTLGELLISRAVNHGMGECCHYGQIEE